MLIEHDHPRNDKGGNPACQGSQVAIRPSSFACSWTAPLAISARLLQNYSGETDQNVLAA